MKEAEHSSVFSCVTGFLICLLLVFLAYFLVTYHLLEGWPLKITLTLLGLIQVWVQLVLFLHLGASSHAKRHIFLLTMLILCIVLFGSLWIMLNLNERVMPSME